MTSGRLMFLSARPPAADCAACPWPCVGARQRVDVAKQVRALRDGPALGLAEPAVGLLECQADRAVEQSGRADQRAGAGHAFGESGGLRVPAVERAEPDLARFLRNDRRFAGDTNPFSDRMHHFFLQIEVTCRIGQKPVLARNRLSINESRRLSAGVVSRMSAAGGTKPVVFGAFGTSW